MITKKSVSHLPSQPGIYIFYQGEIPIYIGKSVSIKTRVISHIASAELSRKEALIVGDADRVDFTTTLSDFDAIVLESKLIRAHKPKYNVIWKDDKKFLYIKITITEEFPKISLCRAENDGKSLYFGPFQSMYVAESLLRHIRRIIPFCMQKKIGKRSCFYSKIGLCNPCPSHIMQLPETEQAKLKREYRKNIKRIVAILSGTSDTIYEELERDLKQAVDEERFEDAVVVRNKLISLSDMLTRNQFEDPLVIDTTPNEDMSVELAAFLKTCFDADIEHDGYRVECYDVSNLFGEHPTGSMVVFEDDQYMKSQYRRFRIKSIKKISDFDMHKEMLERRLKREDWRRPDLIIIDGGKPQVRIAQKVLDVLELNIPLIGLAKKPDRIVFPEHLLVRKPPARTSSLFHMFQALRDESHRFAKKYHKLLRNDSFDSKLR